jgi:nitrate reductase gamma subunit
MNTLNTLAFAVLPYVTLTIFVVGHLRRYITDDLNWNARSSQILESDALFFGSTLFHWGILLTLAGHAGGLLIPQTIFDRVGIDGGMHTTIAVYSGMGVGGLALAGIAILIWRRTANARLRATTRLNDWITLGGLLFVIGAGLYNVLFGHFYVLDTVAPWIRSILILNPKPELMAGVPVSYKIHILSALALLAFSPFSRLVHIWSAPVFYAIRSPLVFRKHPFRS